MTRKGWKAYDKGLVCKGKQYAEGETFEEPVAKICESGMHYCDNPADLMAYHDLVDNDGNMMEITEVEDLSPDDGDFSKDGNSKKYCTKKLKIGAKVSFKDWVKAAVKFVYETTNKSKRKNKDEDYAKLAASGDYAKLAASGYSAQLAASGDSAKLAASGYYAKLAASGDYAKLAASGDYAKLAASGDHSIAAGIGRDNIAKATLGSWIVLAEWKVVDGNLVPVCVKAGQIDGDKLKPDTFYKLTDGEFVEVR